MSRAALTRLDRIIGCFRIEELAPGRWRATNRHTGLVHVTYGTWEEVESYTLTMSHAWERKIALPRSRSPAAKRARKRAEEVLRAQGSLEPAHTPGALKTAQDGTHDLAPARGAERVADEQDESDRPTESGERLYRRRRPVRLVALGGEAHEELPELSSVAVHDEYPVRHRRRA